MQSQSEFDNIHRLTKGDTEKLKERITATTDAITECCKGNHRLCKLQSNVCMGDSDNNWLVKSEHLPYFFKLKVNGGSEKTLRGCIDYRFGSSIVEKTKLNSNSQKVESVNNVIRHSLPKKCDLCQKFFRQSSQCSLQM